MTHMGTDVNELDPAEQELVDFLVPPPRSRRSTVIRGIGYALVLVVFLTLWFTGVIAPGVSGYVPSSQFDPLGGVATIDVELHNDRLFAVDIDRFEVHGTTGSLRDTPVVHLDGGQSVRLSLTIDGASCGTSEIPWLEAHATPVLPISQRLDPIALDVLVGTCDV